MLVQQGRFLFAAWNAVLGDVAARIEGIEDAVCPFGFEILRDEAYRRVVPRRCYVLARVAPAFAGDSDALAWRYCDALLNAVAARDPAFAGSIVLKRVNGRLSKRLRPDGYRCIPSDRLLSIQLRQAPDSALDDYARYLLCVLGGVDQGTLGELVRFHVDTRARRRFFQLAAMLEHVVARLYPAVGTPSLPYRVDQPEEFQQFYDGVTATPPSEAELHHLEVVRPRILQLLTTLRAVGDAPVRVATRDFYSEAPLAVELCAGAAALAEEAVASFRDFVRSD